MKTYFTKFNKVTDEPVDVVKEAPDYEKWHYGKDMIVEEMVKWREIRSRIIVGDVLIVLLTAFIVWKLA